MRPFRVTFLRAGRKRRASGLAIERDFHTGALKVDPVNPKWKTMWVSIEEVEMGKKAKP